MALANDILVKLPYLEPFQPFYHDQSGWIVLLLLLVLGLSPWLLDAILRQFYGLQPLSIDTLANHSPQASRLLQHRQRSLPKLGILPTSAPLALTYGNLPCTARIVVSKGLLKQLADDEIATIYAAQLGHIIYWDIVVMSLFMVLTQLAYIFYWQVSGWGDKRTNQTLRVIAALVANFAYILWFILSVPALWLSQVRIYYSDRISTEITSNPNGLVRAILKVATGVAQNIQQQERTDWLLESWNLFTVVSYQQAITISNLHSSAEIEAGLAWDCLNPLRYWLNINHTHPLIGDRLQRLTRIAQEKSLEPELNLPRLKKAEGDGGDEGAEGENSIQNPKSEIQNLSSLQPPAPSLQPPAPSPFLLQLAPYLGIFFGLALAGLIWLMGAMGIWLGIAQLAWMWGDRGIITGFLPIGVSIGIFIRINRYFPDIKPAQVENNPSLTDLLANPAALPINSQPVNLQGKLYGRRGISNWLGQDLILHLPTGLVKLHHVSGLGILAELLLRPSIHPINLLGRYLFTTGWFRRGATAWIDVDTLRTQKGKISCSSHPLWSTLLASAATAWGIYMIVSSG